MQFSDNTDERGPRPVSARASTPSISRLTALSTTAAAGAGVPSASCKRIGWLVLVCVLAVVLNIASLGTYLSSVTRMPLQMQQQQQIATTTIEEKEGAYSFHEQDDANNANSFHEQDDTNNATTATTTRTTTTTTTRGIPIGTEGEETETAIATVSSNTTDTTIAAAAAAAATNYSSTPKMKVEGLQEKEEDVDEDTDEDEDAPATAIQYYDDVYKVTKRDFDTHQPWKNASAWTTIDRTQYARTVAAAHQSIHDAKILEEVYTACEVYLVPPPPVPPLPNTTHTDESSTSSSSTSTSTSTILPQIKFRCLGHGDNTYTNSTIHDETSQDASGSRKRRRSVRRDDLQDTMCHTVNLCLVVHHHDIINANRNRSSVDYDGDGRNTTNTHRNNTSNNSTAILMMVDSLQYIQKNPKIHQALLNKASYSYLSQRQFYIWIGNLNQSILNRREYYYINTTNPIDTNTNTNTITNTNNDTDATIQTTTKKKNYNGTIFGSKCSPSRETNTMHYYKPIAFIVLLELLSSQSASSTTPSFLFLDADTEFTKLAFDRIRVGRKGGRQNNNTTTNTSTTNDGDDVLGPESYLDLSSQVSIMATQNEKGKMLLNSGIMLIRKIPTPLSQKSDSSSTSFIHDFCALWWYTRCGHKDQLALWLIMFATFSAATAPSSTILASLASTRSGIAAAEEAPEAEESETKSESEVFHFAFPAQIFYAYDGVANYKTFGHFRNYGHKIQHRWHELAAATATTNTTQHDDADDDGDENKNNYNYNYPHPTNINLYNGGHSIQRILTVPMELPHMMILPQAAIRYEKRHKKIIPIPTGTEPTTNTIINLPKIKSDDGNDSFLVHSKSLNSCSDRRCWPYILE